MKFNDIVDKYLTELQSEYKKAKKNKQHTVELSFRPVLDRLLRSLATYYGGRNPPDVVLEPRNQNKAGRPDWLILDQHNLGVYGYVEAKGIEPTRFDIEHYREQVDRYRSLGHNLVITDGLDFLYCDPDKNEPEVVSLIDKKSIDAATWTRLLFDKRLEHVMREMYSSPKARVYDEDTLVGLIAIRTKFLAEELKEYASMTEEEAVRNDDEKAAVRFLGSLRDVVCNHSDSRLRTPDALADFISQVVMFTLLYAHRVACKNEDEPATKERKIRCFMSALSSEDTKLKPFAEFVKFMGRHKEPNIISTWTNECIGFLSYVKLSRGADKTPDYHKLFENFLTEYNAQMRFDFGAYYTPRKLANYIVRLTEFVVREEIGADLYADHNTIIDPCCGTGSFLEEFIKNRPASRKYTLCGFEILPAPYMLANYRIAVLEKELRGGPHKVNIVLANTLHDCVAGGDANEKTIEGAELGRACALSRKPLQLIIGNPPCSDSLRENIGDEYSVINRLMEDFRPPATERHGRQNTQKQVNNPFMQFVRWSCEKLIASKTDSAIAFVVPSSFLEAESYAYARRYLADNFSSIWAVSLDADARTGVRSNSLFHTLQGRAVIIVTRRGEVENKTNSFWHADLSQMSMEDKESALDEPMSKGVRRFSETRISGKTFTFVPSKPFDESFYARFWPVSAEDDGKAVFKRHCSGVKLAPTALFTHVNKGALKRRCKEIAKRGLIGAEEWFKGQAKPPVEDKIEAFYDALKSRKVGAIDKILDKYIVPYVFRPFLYSNVLMWRDLLDDYAKIGGGGTRLRPELQESFADKQVFGFAMAHAPKDLNPTLSQFVSFCWDIPDNDMCTRGNSHIYLNKYFSKEENRVVPNIDDDLVSAVSSLLKCCELQAMERLMFYTYAILCSQVYLDEFEGALFTTNQSSSRARVPYTSDKLVFDGLAKLGEELAHLEKKDVCVTNVLGIDIDRILRTFPNGFRLDASKSHFDDQKEVLYLSDGAKEIEVPCPLAIQQLNISGYDVLKSVWLKFYSYDFTHIPFGPEDLTKLVGQINILAERQRLIAKIDVLVAKVLKDRNLIEPFCPKIGPQRGSDSRQ